MAGDRGFTTQEPWVPLMIVVLLALVAFGAFRQLGHDARVRELLERDLGMLSIAQKAWFQSHRSYGTDLAAVRATGAAPVPPDSNNVLTIVQADSTGFLATGTNARLTGHYRTCGIYLGVVRPPNPALKRPETVSCW